MRRVLLLFALAPAAAAANCTFGESTGVVDLDGGDVTLNAWGGFSIPSCSRLRCDLDSQTLWVLTKNENLEREGGSGGNKQSYREFRSYCMVLTRDGRYARYGRGAVKFYDSRFAARYQDYDEWLEVGDGGFEPSAFGRTEYEGCLAACEATCEDLASDDDARFRELFDSVSAAPDETPRVCFDDDRGEEGVFAPTTWYWVVTVAAFVLLVAPICCACCVSQRCCCLYHRLNTIRNSFAELFPAVSRCLQSCCLKNVDKVSTCCVACCKCQCCCRCGADAAVRETSVEIVSTQPDVEAPPEVAEELVLSRKPASVTEQIGLILWQIFSVKKRDVSGLVKQVFFPSLFFLALWFLYIIMGVSGFGNRWNKSNPNFKRKDGETRDYERGQILSYGLLETFSAQVAFISVMQNVIVGLVVEHHAKLLESARMAGMRDASYWIAHFVADGVIVGFVAALLVAVVASPGLFRFAGHAESFGGPLAPFGILLLTHWVYLVALVAFCFAAAVVIPSAMIASLFSVCVQIAVIVVAFLCAPNSEGKLVSIFEVSPRVQRLWALVPQFAYWLLVQSFLSNRARFCRIVATVDAADAFVGDKYSCDYDDDDDFVDWRDAKRKYRDALYEFLAARDLLCENDDDDPCCDPSVDCSVRGPFSEFPSFYTAAHADTAWTAALFGMLLLDIVLYLLLAWYLNQVVPWSEYGTPRPWYFVVSPGYWREWFCPREAAEAPADYVSMTGGPNEDEAVEARSFQDDVVVTVANLHKTFGHDFKAVDGVSFAVAKSEIFCLLGHNGAGKTTTIACLTGLLPPDRRRETRATVLGHDILTNDGMHRLRATLGVCPQHDILFPRLTLSEHVVFFSRLKGKSKAAALRDAKNLLAVFHLEDRAAHLGSELSGGQKRKLSTSIALAGSSRFIVLDEPTAGMDPVARRELWTLLRSVRRGRAMLLTTHHMDEAEVLGDRIGVMVAGRLKANGSLPFLKRNFSPYNTGADTAGAAWYRLEVWLGDKGDERDLDELVLDKATAFATRASTADELVVTAAPPTDDCLKYNLCLATDEDLRRVAHIFTTLDATDPTAVARYAVATTTLEDVFLHVGKSAEIHNVAKRQDDLQLDQVVRRFSTSSEDHDDPATESRGPIVARQTRAIVNFRARLNARSVRAYATMLTPSLAILVTVILAKEGILDANEHWGALTNIVVALVVVGAYVVVPGLLAQPLVSERRLRLRNLLTISGCDARAFWLGTLAADVALVLFSVVVALVSFAAFGMAYRQRHKVTTYHDISCDPPDSTDPADCDFESDDDKDYSRRLWASREPWLYGLLPIFAFALCAFAHLLSYGFHEPMACVGAFPVLNLVGFIVSPLIVVIAFSLVFGGNLSGTEAVQLVNWTFQELMAAFAWLAAVLSPIGNIFAFMLRVSNLSFIPTDQADPDFDPTWPSYWACFLILAVQLLVFEGLAYLKDRIETRPLRHTPSKFSKARRDRLDPDVLAERDRVLAMLCTEPRAAEDDDEPLLASPPPRAISRLGALVAPLAKFLDQARVALLDQLPGADHPPPLKPSVDVPGLAVVELRKIFPPKRYGATAVEAVKNVTFAVKRGECFGLLGSNGAGKTTTMSMACRVLEPTSGDAKIAGVSTLTDFGKASTNLSVVNQMNTLWEALSCADHVKLFAELRYSVHGGDAEAIARTVASTLVAVELDKHADKLAGRLSGGMKRKLCCACALVADPKVVMLDEPSAGLDPVSQRNLWNLIKRTMIGRSVVLTTHSMLEADVLCDRIAIMTYGQIKCLGTSAHLKTRYTSGYDLVLKLQDDRDLDDLERRVQRFVDDTFADHDLKPRLVATDAGTMTFELGAGGGPQDGLLAKVFSVLDQPTRTSLRVADFVVNPASMEKVFLNIVAESDHDDKQLQAAQLGRRVADELDDDDDDELKNVLFREPTCLGCSKFAHRLLCAYNASLCCFCCVYSLLGIVPAVVPYFITAFYVCFLSCVTCIQDFVGINMCFKPDDDDA